MELILFLLLAQAFAALAIGTRMSGVAHVNGPKLGRIVLSLDWSAFNCCWRSS